MSSTNDGTTNTKLVNVDATNSKLQLTVYAELPKFGAIYILPSAKMTVTVNGTASTGSVSNLIKNNSIFGDSENLSDFTGSVLSAGAQNNVITAVAPGYTITLGQIETDILSTQINLDSNPILSVNNKAFESFDSGGARFNFNSSISSSIITSIKSKMKAAYPQVGSSHDANLPYPIECLLNTWDRIAHDAQTIQNYLTSINLSSQGTATYLSTNSISINNSQRVVGLVALNDSVNSPTIDKAFLATLKNNTSKCLQDSWAQQNSLLGPNPQYPDGFSYLGMNGSDFNGMFMSGNTSGNGTLMFGYPTPSQFRDESYMEYGYNGNTSFGTQSPPTYASCPRAADYLSMFMSAATSDADVQPIQGSVYPNMPQATSYLSLYDYQNTSSLANANNVGSDGLLYTPNNLDSAPNNITYADGSYPFMFGYVTAKTSIFNPDFSFSDGNTYEYYLLGSEQTGLFLMLTGDTFYTVEWAIPCNGLMNDLVIGPAIKSAYSANGVTLTSTGSGTSATTYGDIDLYQDVVVEKVQSLPLSVLQPYSQSFTYTEIAIGYTLPPKLKELRSESANTFDALAKKVLSLRDELNAKLISDVSCKIMNADSLGNICSQYKGYITLINSLPPGEYPTRHDLHNIISLFLLSACELGIYIDFLDAMYNDGPYSSIPSEFSQAGAYANSVQFIQADFPGTPNQLTQLVNGFFMYPSQTKISTNGTHLVTYTQDPADHIFKAHSSTIINKYVDRYEAHLSESIVNLKDTLDPSLDEIRSAFDAMETIATGLLTLGSLTSVISAAKSALHSTLSSNNVSSLQELKQKFPDSFNSFKTQGQSMISGHANTASTQYDHYERNIFIPDSSTHKKALKHIQPMIDSLFSALYTLTGDNSHVKLQIAQFSSDLSTKRGKDIQVVLDKLGNDLLKFNPFKIADDILGDIVHLGVDIAVDVLKAVKLIATDIFKGLADLVSPSSMIVRLGDDLNTLVFNDFSSVPDTTSLITSNTQSVIGSFFPLYYILDASSSDKAINAVTGVQDLNNCQGSPYNVPGNSFFTRNAGSVVNSTTHEPVTWTVIEPYNAFKPCRYTVHLACGDAYIYFLFNANNSAGQITPNNGSFGGVYLEPIPVKSDLGIIDKLATMKKFCEVIYHLPQIYGCFGLLGLDSYKKIWTDFIQKIGSVAGSNDTMHYSADEMAFAASAGYGVSAIYGGLAISDAFSFNFQSMISDGLMSGVMATETYEGQQHAYKVNSEPNIFTNMQPIQDLIDMVGHAIAFGKQFKQYYTSAKDANVTYNKMNDNDKEVSIAYLFNTSTADDTTIYSNDSFTFKLPNIPFVSSSISLSSIKSTNVTIELDPENYFKFTDRTEMFNKLDNLGNYVTMTPVYKPSIVYNFEKVIYTLGEAAASLFIQKKVCDIFTDSVNRSKRIAAIRSKVKAGLQPGDKALKFLNKYGGAKHHRDHNSKARANLINSQTSKLESTLTTQTTTLSGDINGLNIPSTPGGIH